MLEGFMFCLGSLPSFVPEKGPKATLSSRGKRGTGLPREGAKDIVVFNKILNIFLLKNKINLTSNGVFLGVCMILHKSETVGIPI